MGVYRYVLSLVFFLIMNFARGQYESADSLGTNSHRPFHIAFVISHTYLPESTVNGVETLALPSFGLDIEYWFSDRYGIGLHNDLELLTFEIKEGEDAVITRNYPLLLTIDFLWRPMTHWGVFLGPGAEFETEEDFVVFRIGTEYDLSVSDRISVNPIAFYDFRFGAYNSFSIGIGLSYKFGKYQD